MDYFKCPICGNSDKKYIGIKNGKYYCRRCITFNNCVELQKKSYPKNAPIIINYELSKEQKDISDQLVSNFKNGINSLVYAVCGSGKTEIVLESISYVIRSGEKVGFAVPRRDVAIELCERFKNVFKYNSVIAVYGGHHEKVEADLIILTTHQLYRYEKYFDLLIVDEIDAFPYSGNDLLESFLYRSIKSNYIMMSATPSKEVIKHFSKPGFQILTLNKRFHEHFLPVPRVVITKHMFLYWSLYKYLMKFLKETKQVFIFTPTIEICENTYKFLKTVIKDGDYVHSKRDKRDKIIQDFKDGKTHFLVTTAVLERGVTVKDLQVIVFYSNHSIYSSAALIQIAGRAGRKKDAPDGKVIFIGDERTESMEEAISEIEHQNRDMQDLL